MRQKTFGIVVFLLLWLPQQASALCTLVCSCTTSTTAVAFGVYNIHLPTALDGVGNVRVTCGGVLGLLVPYDIALGKGMHSSNFSPRKMASGSDQLNYDLYTSSARTTIWGDGTSGTQVVSGSVTIVLLGGTSSDHPVYGRIPSGQTSVPPGSYSDTVLVTVTYQ